MKSGNKATTEKTVQVTTPVTSNGTANIATYPKLKSDLVQQNWDNIANYYQKNTPTHLNPTGTQANFVIRDPNTRTTLTNGHLNIK